MLLEWIFSHHQLWIANNAGPQKWPLSRFSFYLRKWRWFQSRTFARFALLAQDSKRQDSPVPMKDCPRFRLRSSEIIEIISQMRKANTLNTPKSSRNPRVFHQFNFHPLGWWWLWVTRAFSGQAYRCCLSTWSRSRATREATGTYWNQVPPNDQFGPWSVRAWYQCL